jgi:hypothetical protein
LNHENKRKQTGKKTKKQNNTPVLTSGPPCPLLAPVYNEVVREKKEGEE